MDIYKRCRDSEDVSPKKYVQSQIPEKKFKLSQTEDSLGEYFDEDFLFDDSLNMDGKCSKENQQANFQVGQEVLKAKSWYRLRIKSYERDSISFDLKIRLYREEYPKEEIMCRLQGPWCQTKFHQDDLISLFAIWSGKYECYVVNNAEGFFVINPDYLISGTTVVGSLFCQRKAVLQDRFRGIDANNKIMVIGTIVHQLMQRVLEKKILSESKIEELAKEILNSKDVIFVLYLSKMSLAEAEDEIRKFIPNIVNFLDKYVIGKSHKRNKDEFADSIEHIQDIEENLWIPQLGLKGKIDVTVKIHRKKRDSLVNLGNQNKILPLELKTGRASFSAEHKGQLILYQMMLQEVGFNTDSGLLLYLRDGIMKEISASRNEKRDLIILRNEISYYLTRGMKLECDQSKFQTMSLPEPINHHSACSKCPYSTICTTFLRTDESIQLSENNPLKAIFAANAEYFKSSHIDYFLFWCGIISLEQDEINKFNNINSLWIHTPEERLKLGKALIDLKIDGAVEFIAGRYIHKFTIHKSKSQSDIRISGISIGEYVLVSTLKRISIAAGTVYDITRNSISISLERNLLQNYANGIFIVDKYESKSGNVFNFTNIGLLLDDTDHISFLRNIIIEKKPPSFAKKLPAILAREGKPILEELNNIQQTAVLKALSTDSYILIKGLPGTGKTQTLVAIIRLLNLLKKSVIITSHTHSAVDNVLLRLKKHNISFLRLGSDKRIHPDLIEYSESNHIKDCNTPEELEKVYNSFSIIGVTCLGSGHAVFTHKSNYDVCIVDEATQVYQPTVIRPLLFAKRFILVGDPDQLPPLVRSKKAREMGADESLFHRLNSSIATTTLTLQYRMNKVITKLANDLTYDDKLRCGNESTMMACLNFANQSSLLKKYSKQKWILRALERHVDQSVIFLDTKDCRERSLNISKEIKNDLKDRLRENLNEACFEDQKRNEHNCVNYCEAAIVFVIIKAFICGGYHSKDIGIIAPYRAQVELLRKIQEEFIKDNNFLEGNLSELEINTVDQYQGRDKNIIIYSCTKTGLRELSKETPTKPSNEILQDRRRLTVAITRSKHKLIMVGDQDCLKSYTPFNDLLSKIPSRCKQELEEGKLGFEWTDVLTEIKKKLMR